MLYAHGVFVSNTTGYAYTAVGSRESVTLPNGVTTQYVYDNLNRLVRETLSVPGAGMGYEAEYDYDLAGNRLTRRVRAGGQLLTTRYSYDDNDRLVREDSTVALAALAVAPDGVRFMSVSPSLVLIESIDLVSRRKKIEAKDAGEKRLECRNQRQRNTVVRLPAYQRLYCLAHTRPLQFLDMQILPSSA